MPLKIYFSNRLEHLTQLLEAQAHDPDAFTNVFDPLRIIAPTTAMQRYLVRAMADQQGICANVQFDFLAQWLWQQLALYLPERRTQAPYDAHQLVWRIFTILGDAQWPTQFPRLAAYLQQADARMRYDLAKQITSHFEQYLTYRPDWLDLWSEGSVVEFATENANADQAWQAALWQTVCAAMGTQTGNPLPALQAAMAATVAKQADEAGEAGEAEEAVPVGPLPTTHIFAPPTLAPLHLALLQQLATQHNIVLYLLNPCQEYWFDVVNQRRLAYLSRHAKPGREPQALYHEEGNRLLAGWGQQTQASLRLLLERSDDALVDDAEFHPNPAPHLLAALQNAVLELRDLAPCSHALAPTDRSIEVHVCHSLGREIEVLQTRLLALFADRDAPGGPPAPHEVVVVTPDIDAAAPLIEAIFGTAPRALHIPYTISGRARLDVNAPARALLDLLALIDSRCTVTDLFGLLQQPPVARRFGLDDDALSRIRGWLEVAGAHWGLNGAHRANFDLPADPRHTLADALARLLAGYATPIHIDQPFDGILPAVDIEGTQAHALGALATFLQQIQTLQQRASKPLQPTEWTALLASTLAQFLQPSNAALEDLRALHNTIEKLERQLLQAEVQSPLSLELVRVALTDLLEDPARGGVPTGMVTFTSMNSLRNIPYRVVCILGLNDGAFPGQSAATEFDLMAQQPRPGDRQRRLEERNAFLDLLLCARDAVHLSYVGRSVRDNSVMPPSVVVAELLEYLLPVIAEAPAATSLEAPPAGEPPRPNSQALAMARQRLVVEHPLQPFSEVAFRSDSDVRVRSFHAEYALALENNRRANRDPANFGASTNPLISAIDTNAAVDPPDGDDEDTELASRPAPGPVFFNATLPVPDTAWRTVSMDQLLRFLVHPRRYLLERRLGLELPRSVTELEDDEPLLPENRHRRWLAERVLPRLLSHPAPNSPDAIQAARALALAGTELPSGALGEAFLDRELLQLGYFAEQVGQLNATPVACDHSLQQTFDWGDGPWNFSATVAGVRPSGLVHWRYDEMKPRDVLAVWLQHLVLSCAKPPGVLAESVLLTREGQAFFRPTDNPQALLQKLLQLYAEGLQKPSYFFPKSAWAYLTKGEQRNAALAEWQESRQNRFAESADAANQLALRGLADPLFSSAGFTQFEDCARTVYAPLLAHLIRS